jgi:hypothetical protein
VLVSVTSTTADGRVAPPRRTGETVLGEPDRSFAGRRDGDGGSREGVAVGPRWYDRLLRIAAWPLRRGPAGAWRWLRTPGTGRRDAGSWLASLVLHATLLLLLGLVGLGRPVASWRPGLVASSREPLIEPTTLSRTDHGVELRPDTSLDPQMPNRQSQDTMGLSFPVDLPRLPTSASLGRPRHDVQLPVVLVEGGGLEGRGAALRGRLVEASGGNGASENAVARGLRWLIAHQLDDGSWRFDLRQCPQCRGRCRNWGSIGSSTASTALALLPFLGAGHTHLEGAHQDVVGRGLYYLAGRMIMTPQGGDLQEGTMYSQGLATIALCEAYAMTRDETLRPIAQAAVDFIVAAQHKAGGWRYGPGQPGDTTVTGWQVMALKSAQLAGLKVPQPTWYAVSRFLDSVETDHGAGYGYQSPKDQPTTTAIGLLCRMYLGWPRDHAPLVDGVGRLTHKGPSRNNMYFNFYATQVLHHYGGPAWDQWNKQLRDTLVRTQATKGHESGSWQFTEAHTRAAGRLYNTAMAIMILEIYYRHMPLYAVRPLGVAP